MQLDALAVEHRVDVVADEGAAERRGCARRTPPPRPRCDLRAGDVEAPRALALDACSGRRCAPVAADELGDRVGEVRLAGVAGVASRRSRTCAVLARRDDQVARMRRAGRRRRARQEQERGSAGRPRRLGDRRRRRRRRRTRCSARRTPCIGNSIVGPAAARPALGLASSDAGEAGRRRRRRAAPAIDDSSGANRPFDEHELVRVAVRSTEAAASRASTPARPAARRRPERLAGDRRRRW